MIRNSVFWGLTLVLVVVLVWLVIRSRQTEKQAASAPVEVVQESEPTPTRVVAPADIEIVQSKMELAKEAHGERESYAAKHHVVVRDSGKVRYGSLQLRFTYLSRGGKALMTRTCSISKTILPESTSDLGDISIDGIPAAAGRYTAEIIYADIETAPATPVQSGQTPAKK